jgi:hypothetical protein
MRRSSKRKSAEGQIILLSLGWGPKRGPGPSLCLIHPSAWKGDSPKLVSAILNILIQEEGGAMPLSTGLLNRSQHYIL